MYKKILPFLLILLASFSHASEEDYLKARLALAKSENYKPYPLYAIHTALLEKHYKLGNDPETSIDEVNEPLHKLSEIYPLGIQVNNAIAAFLEYVAGLSEDQRASSWFIGNCGQKT